MDHRNTVNTTQVFATITTELHVFAYIKENNYFQLFSIMLILRDQVIRKRTFYNLSNTLSNASSFKNM